MISQRAQDAFDKGKEWEERGNSTKAINAYRQAVAIEPDWVAPHERLGAIFMELGQYDEAIAAYRRAKASAVPGDDSITDRLQMLERIQQGTLDPMAYRYYLMARDMPDETLNEKMSLCQQALSLSPDFAAPYSILGKILLAKGHPNQARAVLERGLALEPPAFTRALLLFDLGNVLLVSGQRDEALRTFRQIVELDANPKMTRFARTQLDAADANRI
jgi:superkiller protein 3